jgi:hypothetical protein
MPARHVAYVRGPARERRLDQQQPDGENRQKMHQRTDTLGCVVNASGFYVKYIRFYCFVLASSYFPDKLTSNLPPIIRRWKYSR